MSSTRLGMRQDKSPAIGWVGNGVSRRASTPTRETCKGRAGVLVDHPSLVILDSQRLVDCMRVRLVVPDASQKRHVGLLGSTQARVQIRSGLRCESEPDRTRCAVIQSMYAVYFAG